MEMSSHLKRVSAAMRLPSCDDEQQNDVLEQQLDVFWAQDLLHGRFPQVQESNEISLERQFQSGDFLNISTKPTIAPIKKAPVRHDSECVLRGEDIGDIPTSYVISGLKSSEIPVIGTYVDRRIVPGFRYRVRQNQSEKYLFGGRPLHLENIGCGYGKRLVFEGTSRNNNENYFWSDSQPDGYGFKPVALWEGDRVTLTKEVPGGDDVTQEVDVIACVSQVEVNMKVKGKGEVEKRFQVKFLCRPTEAAEDNDRASLVVAVAVVSKGKGHRRATLEKLLLATQCSVRASSFVVRNRL